ncbi:hypothetical protein SCMC78_21100 [Streptomyces sp. CMC78]|uniref:FXSXX-COOH protein n=1 Tax=Streptomyces sp. CMC78 TaxID=3231512 RepID=A0AB33KAW6_9ACTN
MAYEPRAAASIQAAETSSPRESASVAQPMAPARATRLQTTMDFGVGARRPGAGGTGGADVGVSGISIRPLARSLS